MARGLRRFFVDSVFSKEGALLELSPSETNHLSRVLRLKLGDSCWIFNRQGLRAEAVVETFSGNKQAALRLGKISPMKKSPLFLKVGQALPQKKKLDNLIEKAEELGVHELWTLETKRNIVRMREEARQRVRERWDRIVIEAAKQSGSTVLMRVEGPLPFSKVIEEKLESSDLAFLFHLDPKGLHFSEMIQQLKSVTLHKAPSVFLFFGPEGGFTHEEVAFAESHGIRKVFLGDSTLRLETAFLGVVGAIKFLMN